uniref:KIB1-4 beta-propeller domain-containing protein n=3 Tax=Setaria italica TaxID=4555 RepID=K3YM74_SETIT
MSCLAWPTITNSMAAAAMFSKLSDGFSKYVCGILPPTTTADEDRYRAGLRSLFLLSPSPERPPRRTPSPSPSASVRTEALLEDDDGDETATMPWGTEDDDREEEMASTLPCLAFASEHGYRVFSLAEMRLLDGDADAPPPMPPVLGRRLVPSPYGGTVLATDVCYRHPCHLVDPFTGERAPLPDLPIPFSESEPVKYHPNDFPRPHRARVTDDGLAWDWSPRGVMVARGDTAFFCAHGGDGGEWTPVHQAVRGSPMTVNYRAGRFFLLELRSLVTTVIDAATLRARATIPAPAGLRDADAAYLAPSDDGGAVLLVHRAGEDGRGVLFTEAYRARDSRGSPRWARARDIGDRAVFVDGAHAFTVAAGPAGAGALANRVYVVLANRVERPCGRVAVAYDVGCSHLGRPELMGRLRLDVGEVEPMWGQPHWIIRRDGSGRHA